MRMMLRSVRTAAIAALVLGSTACTEIDNALASVPVSARVLITAHDAFTYFGQRYGFEVLGVQGVSTAAEAGATVSGHARPLPWG